MAYSLEHYQANKVQYAAKSRAWRETNPLKAAENRRRYYLEHKEKELKYSTDYNRKQNFGVSKEQYTTMLSNQEGVCAICNLECSRALAVDHDHKTNEVRGLLCNNCNRALGHFKDSKENLARAIAYLEQGPVQRLVRPLSEPTTGVLRDSALTMYNEAMNKDRE